MYIPSIRCVAIALLLSLLTTASAQEKATVHLPGGGMLGAGAKVGYFPNTTGGIDAIDLANGKLLWSSKDADRPLVATADRLYAQAGKTSQVRVFAFDARDGKTVLESEAIKFPEWVSVQTALGRMFRSGAGRDDKGLWLSWEAQAFYAGGARPSPEIEKAARKNASGVARIDVKTGKIEPLSAEQIAAGKFPLSTGSTTKVGDVTLSAKDTPAKNAKNPFQMQRMLVATNQAKVVVWQREIAAPVVIPPPP